MATSVRGRPAVTGGPLPGVLVTRRKLYGVSVEKLLQWIGVSGLM